MTWIDFSGAGGTQQRIFDFGNSSEAGYMYLTPDTGTNMNFTINSNTGNVVSQINAPTLPTGWHHVALVINSATMNVQLYLDGESIASGPTQLLPSDLGKTANNWIGRSQWGAQAYLDASLDDFRIYNYALTQQEISEVMKGDPLPARKPTPANKTVIDIEKALPLTWTPGEKAAQHDVYLGTNPLAVESADISDTTGIYRGRYDPNNYMAPEGVEPGQTYYWRVDEINTDGTISVGRVWSFMTVPYLVVDDFEYYNDVNNVIYNVWTDYFVNSTGMTVGYFEPPYAEQDIVHGGRQAMYMRYDNDGTVNEGTNFEKSGTSLYSEADRQWTDAQDFTRKGANSLTLWFRGIPGPRGSFTPGTPIKMTAVGTDIGGTADQLHFAYKKLSGNGVITAKVLSITNTDSLAKAGVMMRESLDAGSKHFSTVACPNSRVYFVRRTTTGGTTTSTSKTGVAIPVWVRLTRSGNTFTAQYSTNGNTWTQVGTPQEIQMSADVYVGLCLTSRNVNATCTAEFSDVSITGTVTGDWQSQDIGIKANSQQPLYVALQDSAGQSAVVKYSNPSATTKTTWTQWNIPLTNFTGVNLQSIQKLSIGVGDRAATQPGGAGDLYIDDIGLKLP
jgi:regulation of enolase protein 1 (concanavalin A-like superfamily)